MFLPYFESIKYVGSPKCELFKTDMNTKNKQNNQNDVQLLGSKFKILEYF